MVLHLKDGSASTHYNMWPHTSFSFAFCMHHAVCLYHDFTLVPTLVQDPHDSILCLLHDSKLHLTASFSLTCHWHVSLLQAAPRSSELASDSSTREEPRETCSCQEGGVRCADLSALRHIAATHGHHPSSQSSRVCCWTSRFRFNHAVH